MPPPEKLHDPRCYELAEFFLRDVAGTTKEDIQELANEIQETIEDFISAMHEDSD